MGFDIFMLGATVVAAGALTWFVIWYFFSPSDTESSSSAKRSGTSENSQSSDEAYAALYGDREHEAAALSRLVLVGIVLTAIVFALAVLALFGSDDPNNWTNAAWIQSPWLQAILITPVMFYCGRPIHHIGLHAIAKRSPDINSLISIGTSAAYIYSLAVCVASDFMPEGSREPYFESVGVTITLVLLGRLMETKSRAKSASSVRQLAELLPKIAHLVPKAQHDRTDPSTAAEYCTDVDSDALTPGDIVLVGPGESFPADGSIVAGEALIDESAINGQGESPLRGPGQRVHAGTVASSGPVLVRCTKVGRHSTLGGIVDVAAKAQNSKAPVQRLTDIISRIVVPVVMLIAIWTFAIWVVLGPQPRLSHAVVTAINVLIIACPCALGLVTPLSVSASVNLGAANGILLSSAKVLQRGARIRTVVLDQSAIGNVDEDDAHGTASAVKSLHDRGIRTILMGSGESTSTVEEARRFGIEEVIASVNQQDKKTWIKRLIAESEPGDLVALASDGFENAAVLNSADVGFAMGSGADGMLQSSDVTLVNGDLRGIPNTIRLCEITIRNIRENFIWAMAFNLLSIPIAVGVLYPFTGWLLNPVIAAVAMALSSLCVVLNAHRLHHQVIRITANAQSSSRSTHEPRLIEG
jgi:Cu+-exporting ATPase